MLPQAQDGAYPLAPALAAAPPRSPHAPRSIDSHCVQKCDGARPVCAQCSKANRSSECQYYEKKRTSRTQLLQAKITKLEARLRELEAEHSSPDSSSSGSQSPQTDRASLAYHRASFPFYCFPMFLEK